MWFKALGGALYRVEEVTPDLAASVGCPAATHRLVGSHTTTYGTFDCTGRKAGQQVQVPGFSRDAKGLRVVFVSANPIEWGMIDEVVIDGHFGD